MPVDPHRPLDDRGSIRIGPQCPRVNLRRPPMPMIQSTPAPNDRESIYHVVLAVILSFPWSSCNSRVGGNLARSLITPTALKERPEALPVYPC